MSEPAPPDLAPAALARAARVLWIRSRREATGILAGEYTSAFRGGGIEFEESRPYVAGDDVRSIDWNATARTGTPWVKRFREERSRTVLLALDVSASMAFGSGGRSKGMAAAHAAALLAAAAGQSGDRLGLVSFSHRVLDAVPPARGDAHSWRVIRSAVAAAQRKAGGTALEAACAWLERHARGRAVIVILSDYRDAHLTDPSASSSLRGRLRALGRRHDAVAIVCEDPRERELPAAGVVRVRDPEAGDSARLLMTRRASVRRRYAHAAAARRQALQRTLQAAAFDPLWLSTDSDPLRTLSHFFRQRSARLRIAS